MALLRKLVAVILIAWSFSASADTYPAVPGYGGVVNKWGASAGGGGLTADAACKSNANHLIVGPDCSESTRNGLQYFNDLGACKQCGPFPSGTGGGQAYQKYFCPYGGTRTSDNQCINAAPCAQDQERVNGQCLPVCPPPKVRNQATGVCESPPDPCAGQSATSNGWYSFPRSTGFVSATYCDGGCAVGLNPSGAGVQYSLYYTAHKVTMYGTKTQLGYKCEAGTPSVPTAAEQVPPEPPKKPVCLPSEGVLTSSTGTVACVPAGVPNAETPQVLKSTKKETYPDGSTKSTETVVTRAPSTGATETTVIQTATGASAGGQGAAGPVGTGTASSSTGPGGNAPSSTGAGTSDKPASDNGDFCQKNPGLQICKNDIATEGTAKAIKEALSPTEPADKSALDTAMANKEAEEAHKAKIEEIGNQGQTNPNGWFAWAMLPDAPASGCVPFSGSLMGRQITLDWCDEISKIREIAGYAFYIFTAFALFSIFAGAFGVRKT